MLSRGVALRREYKKRKRETAPIYTQPGVGKGTFSQKVGQALPEQPQQLSRGDALTEYRKLGGSKTAEGRAYADRYLR